QEGADGECGEQDEGDAAAVGPGLFLFRLVGRAPPGGDAAAVHARAPPRRRPGRGQLVRQLDAHPLVAVGTLGHAVADRRRVEVVAAAGARDAEHGEFPGAGGCASIPSPRTPRKGRRRGRSTLERGTYAGPFRTIGKTMLAEGPSGVIIRTGAHPTRTPTQP